MDQELQYKLFEDDNISTLDEFKKRLNQNTYSFIQTNMYSFIQREPIERYEWVFQFDNDEPISFFTTHTDMINPNGDLIITCRPSNVTHLEFKKDNKTFKIYSRNIN